MAKLVLLPGMDGSGFFFRDFIAALCPAVEPTVMRYPVDRGLGYPELEALVRDSLPPDEPFVLVGESFSGPIAIALASTHPTGLVAVVLVCTFARSPAPVMRTFRHWLSMAPVWLLPVRARGGRDSMIGVSWHRPPRITHGKTRHRFNGDRRLDPRRHVPAYCVSPQCGGR